MSFDFKLIVRDKYSEEIFDIINICREYKGSGYKN